MYCTAQEMLRWIIVRAENGAHRRSTSTSHKSPDGQELDLQSSARSRQRQAEEAQSASGRARYMVLIRAGNRSGRSSSRRRPRITAMRF